jgi:hypothetical protein
MLKCKPVETIQAVFRPEPHETACVLPDRQHGLLRQAFVRPETLEAHRRGRMHRAAQQGSQQHRQRICFESADHGVGSTHP